MWWILGFLYGAVAWLISKGASGQVGWRRYVLYVGLLIPVVPLYNVLVTSGPETQLSAAVGTVVGVLVLAVVDGALRSRATSTANRVVPLSAEAADKAYRLIIRDKAATLEMSEWPTMRRMILVMVAAVLLTTMQFWFALIEPELVSGGTLDGSFNLLKWIGVGVGVLGMAVYIGCRLLLHFRSYWRTLGLTDEEFDAAQERFARQMGI